MHVRLRAGAMILPALAAVARAHQAAELDPDQEQVGVVRAGGDPAHVRSPRPRREAPVRPRGQLEQRLQLRQLSPRSSLRNSRLGSVPAYTAPSAALTASENTRLGQAAVEPAPAAVDAAAHAALAQTGVDGVGIGRVDRQALRAACR